MARFLLRRMLHSIWVIVGVVLVIFLLFFILPVDPSRTTLGQRSDVQTREAVARKYGLDKPWHIRFGIYLGNLSPVWVHQVADRHELRYLTLLRLGDGRALGLKWPYLGRSFQTDGRVGEILLSGLWSTVILSFSAILLGLIIGISSGVLAAANQGNWIDRIAVLLASVGVSIPSYLAGILLSYFLGYVLKEYTGLNMIGSLFDHRGHLELKNLILPTLALGVRPVAIVTQLTRTSMLEVLHQDFVRTATAKGLSRTGVLIRHALRNALNPVLTSVTGWFASLLAGAYFVEIIFDFKGLGYLTVRAIGQFDFPLIMGAVLLGALFFTGINIFADIMYAALDPRVKSTR